MTEVMTETPVFGEVPDNQDDLYRLKKIEDDIDNLESETEQSQNAINSAKNKISNAKVIANGNGVTNGHLAYQNENGNGKSDVAVIDIIDEDAQWFQLIDAKKKMENLKVEPLIENEICCSEDIRIEYLKIKEEITDTSSEKRRALIVPKSELDSEYDYIKAADITICESTIWFDDSTQPTIEMTCEICKTKLSESTVECSMGEQNKVCNACSKTILPQARLMQTGSNHTIEIKSKQKTEMRSGAVTKRTKTNGNKSVHSERPFECNVCHNKFKFKNNLKEHLLIHTGEKPFQCEECLKRFRLKPKLKDHLLIHKGETPFECSECPRKCRLLATLKRHMLIHTGEKPYQCDKCLRKFRNGTHLKRHKLTHIDERPYECFECSYKCRKFTALRNHMFTHRGIQHQCDQCSKIFACRSSLRQHEQTHTDDKPFECNQCSFKSRSKGNLTQHIHRHTKQSLHCDQCALKFFSNRHLKEHRSMHTPIEKFEM